jgi:hypothetical protein
LEQLGVELVQRRQIFLPLTVIIEKVVGDIETIIAGRMWLVQQSHPCFIRRASAFAPVAGNTGANHIVPGVPSTPPPRNDVV